MRLVFDRLLDAEDEAQRFLSTLDPSLSRAATTLELQSPPELTASSLAGRFDEAQLRAWLADTLDLLYKACAALQRLQKRECKHEDGEISLQDCEDVVGYLFPGELAKVRTETHTRWLSRSSSHLTAARAERSAQGHVARGAESEREN